MISSESISQDLFLKELQREYDAQWDLKKALESKAISLTAINGTVTTLLFGFTTFLLNYASNNTLLPLLYGNLMYLVLLSSVFISVGSMLISILSYRIQDYYFVSSRKIFFDDKHGTIKTSVVDQYKQASKEDFLDITIDSYIGSIKLNEDTNQKKAKMLMLTQWLLFVTIALIGIAYSIFGYTNLG